MRRLGSIRRPLCNGVRPVCPSIFFSVFSMDVPVFSSGCSIRTIDRQVKIAYQGKARRRSGIMKNQFCDSKTLKNEASVEKNFVDRFLTDLGYGDDDIRPKTCLKEIKIGKG